jgi:hypothetical protein
MSELLVIILIGAAIVYWQAASRCKEIAVAGARKECTICDVQLLDQTVHQVKVSLSRDITGRWRVWREYRFEYSQNGENRHKGTLVLLGQRTIRVALDTFSPLIH